MDEYRKDLEKLLNRNYADRLSIYTNKPSLPEQDVIQNFKKTNTSQDDTRDSHQNDFSRSKGYSLLSTTIHEQDDTMRSHEKNSFFGASFPCLEESIDNPTKGQILAEFGVNDDKKLLAGLDVQPANKKGIFLDLGGFGKGLR
jgi:hypothetical protein